MKTIPEIIDDFIDSIPDEKLNVKKSETDWTIREHFLHKIRDIIRKNAPESEERIRYGIPTFYLKGNLVHFASFKKHIGFYPTPSGITEFREELSSCETAKGSVQFPLNRPVPYDLIERIIQFRVENMKEEQ